MASMQQVVRRLSIEATTRGVKEAEQAARGLSKAVDGVAVSSQRAERATQSMEGRLASIQRKYDEQYRAQMELAKVERTLMQAQQQGLVTQQRRLELLSLAAQRHGLATAAINREKAATDALAASQTRQAAANDNQWRRRNLQFQLFDVGQGLAGGLNPAMIAAQQGPQIVQMYAGAGGVNAALQDTVGLLGTVAKGFGPVAVAAGVGALAISGMRSEIEDTTGVAVTFGDVFKSVFQVIGRGIYDFIEPAVSAIAPWFEQAWSLVETATAATFNGIIRITLVAFETIKHYVGQVPDAFIVAGQAAAQGFVDAITWMAREAVATINSLIAKINGAMRAAGFDKQFGDLGSPQAAFPGFKIDIGGIAAWERLSAGAATYQATLQEIATTDYTGKFFDAVSDAAVANRKAAEEAEKNAGATKKAGDAAGKATDPWKGMREATVDATDSLHDFTEEASQAGQQLKDTLGNVLQDLFSGPIEDADEFFGIVMSGFADLGRQNLGKFMDLFGGQGSASNTGNSGDAWDGGWREVGSLLEPSMMKGVQTGSFAGVRDGMVSAFKSMGMSSKVAGNAADGIGATVGAFAMGYEQQSPLMGGLSGAMSGAAAGTMIMPGIGTVVGAIIGGVAGALGGMLGQSDEEKRQKEQAKAALESNTQAITALIQFSNGGQPGVLQKSYQEQYDANRKLQEVAMAAGDKSLVRDLQSASNRTFSRLYDILISDFDDLNDALRAGLGRNSALMEGKEVIRALSEQVQQWVGDVRFMTTESDRLGGGNIGAAGIEARVREAQEAGQEMILAALRGVEALSPVAEELQRIEGASKAALQPLTDLGMSVEEATARIAAAADEARQKLADNFMAGVDQRFYASADMGYVNDLKQLAEFTKTQLDNSAAIGGLGMDRIRETFTNEAQKIVNDADLSSDQVAEATGILAGVLAAIGETIPQAIQEVTTALFDRAGLQSKINDASGKGYLNQFGALGTELTGLLGQTNSLADVSLIGQYQVAAARSIAESSGLSSEALRGLATVFPQFGRTILQVADDMDKAAETAQRAEEASAAAAAAAARRAAILGLQPGLLERTQGTAASQDFQLSQLQVGNVGLSGIRNAGSVDAARAQLELFINTIKRTGQSADDITSAGQLAYQVFDQVAQSLEAAQSEADRLAESFQSMAESVSDSLTSFADRATSEMKSAFDQTIDTYRGQYSDLIDSITGAKSYLDSIATLSTNPQTQFEIMQGRFRDAASAASGGSAEALRGLTGQAGSYLDAAAQFFPAGTQQYFQAVEEVRAALGTGIGAAQDRANSVQGQIERLNTLMEAQTRVIQDTVGRLIEQVKSLGLGQTMLLDQIAATLEEDKPAADLLRAVQMLIAETRTGNDQLSAIAKKKAA